MGYIAQDTFSGRTSSSGLGTASDGNVWYNFQTQSAFSVASGEGKCLNTAGGAAQSNHYYLGKGVSIPHDITLRFALASAGDVIGLNARQYNLTNYYQLNITSTTFSLQKNFTGTVTTLTSANQTFTPGTFYRAHFRVYASNLMARVWLDGTSEPNNWMLTAGDNSLISYGAAGIYLSPTNTSTALQFDSFVAQDSFQNNGPIYAADYNSIIQALKPAAGSTVSRKYTLQGGGYAANTVISQNYCLVGRQSVPVSVGIDSADIAPVGASGSVSVGNNSLSNGFQYGFQIYIFTSAATTDCYCGGNLTVQY